MRGCEGCYKRSELTDVKPLKMSTERKGMIWPGGTEVWMAPGKLEREGTMGEGRYHHIEFALGGMNVQVKMNITS